MGWLLTQTVGNKESQHEIRTLQETSKCLFDLGKNGARLKPIAFCLRSCTYFERKYHSFV